MINKIKARLRDWRARIALVAIAMAYLASAALGYWLKDSLIAEPNAVWVSFYASWVEDVLFFSLIGIAVIVYTEPFRPDMAYFEERIQAFYGSRAPEPLRLYARDELRRYGGYSPYASRVLVVREWSKDFGGYRVEIHSEFEIRNLFEDVEYFDDPVISITPDIFENGPSPVGEVEWISVGHDEALVAGPVRIDPIDGFSERVNFSIPSGGEIRYEYRYWVWMKVGEVSRMIPQRVVEKFDMVVRNAIAGTAVSLQVGGAHEATHVEPGRVLRLPIAYNVTPRDNLFEITFLEPPEGIAG